MFSLDDKCQLARVTEEVIGYYERNGFHPLFPRINDEKAFYNIPESEDLRTRMYYYDLL